MDTFILWKSKFSNKKINHIHILYLLSNVINMFKFMAFDGFMDVTSKLKVFEESIYLHMR